MPGHKLLTVMQAAADRLIAADDMWAKTAAEAFPIAETMSSTEIALRLELCAAQSAIAMLAKQVSEFQAAQPVAEQPSSKPHMPLQALRRHNWQRIGLFTLPN